mgnify:CR=1 FL=1
MLKDITLGQFCPGSTVIHRMDPRVKMLLMIAYIALVFLVKGFLGYLILAVYLGLAIALAHLKIQYMMRSLKPILFIVVMTLVLNILFTRGEHPLVEWGILKIYREGIEFAVFMALRLIFLLLGTSLLTLTTSPMALTDALERLLKPLKAIHFPVHEMAMMMSIALRFIPTLAEETDRIRKAQAARGADFDTGSIFKRAASLIPLLVPLFVSAFRRADELATAMEARCYHGGEGRTKLNVLHMHGRDYLALMIMVAAYLLATVGGF